MQQLTAILHRGDLDEGGFWATCSEVPSANGQGETQEECLRDLSAAVRLILELNEEEALRDDSAAVKLPLSLACGEFAVAAGRTFTHSEAKQRLIHWLK